MNFKEMNQSQMKEILDLTNKLADAMMQAKRVTNNFSANEDARHKAALDEAERSAREYAKNRNAGGGIMPSRDADLSEQDKAIRDQTKNWITRQKRRGWWGK
jgi:hypothetical protein